MRKLNVMKLVLGVTNPRCGSLKTTWNQLTVLCPKRFTAASGSYLCHQHSGGLQYYSHKPYFNGFIAKTLDPRIYSNYPSWTKRYNSSRNEKTPEEKGRNAADGPEEGKPLSVFQKFKIMYKNYWYVLVPVHIVTSIGWFGGFYYLVKSGFDVVALLESCNFSEVIIKPMKDSSAGYVALAYALYKVATPLRYTVTLGGTTLSINYLTKWGLIKPIPPKEKLKEMYEEKKENLKERRDQIKEKGEAFMREFRDRSSKNK